jgi:hypothetical protein
LEEIQEISERYADAEKGWSNGDMSEIWQIIETLFYEKPEWPEPGAPARAEKPPLGDIRGEC